MITQKRNRYLKSLIILTIIVASSFSAVFAQSSPASGQAKPTPTPTPATPRLQGPADEEALRNATQVKDIDQRVDAFIKFVADFPKAPYIRNTIYYLVRGIKPLYTSDPQKARTLIARFVDGTSSATVYARSEFYYNLARDLLNNNVLPDLAESLAAKGVAVVDEAAYIENERVAHEQREKYFLARDPKFRPTAFSVAQAQEKFRTFRALHYATLGRAYLKTGKPDDAEKALKQAQQIAPSMEAATALADLLEQRGRSAEALEYLGAASLTGRLPATGVTRLHDLYRKLNNGKLDGLEDSLDARYRKSFRAPVKPTPYRSPAARPKGAETRATLAEFITGAGCEPCTSVDLSFDAALERYSRRDLVLLVYHMHAPTSDPMSNHSGYARTKYYGANGAPTVYLDGTQIEPGEGLRTETEGVFKNLDASIAERLLVKAGATIKLDASFTGNKINVATTVDGIKTAAGDLKLRLALVEEHVSYSGENGLRFHPMVVRSIGRTSEGAYGFAVDASKAQRTDYVFDLDQITAENLKYYDDYIADMKKRIPGLEIGFKEKRYLIDRQKLAVVAFVQDDTTKEVLQSVFLRLSPSATKSGH